MFIELIDALRCPNKHEESWLVASANRMEARHIVQGTLGCPVCAAEYPIAQGVVDFRTVATTDDASDHHLDSRVDVAMRIAAMLNLTDASGFAVLLGFWGGHAELLTHVAETPLLLVDPPSAICGTAGISVIRTNGAMLPLAPHAARAIAIDGGSDARIMSAVKVAKPKARVLAPIFLPSQPGVRELARDDLQWVGEREADASPLVTLHVRRAE